MNHVSTGLDGLKRAFLYTWNHPHLFLLALNQFSKQRFLVPLDSIRWIIKTFLPQNVPIKRLQLHPRPPGIQLVATIEVMDSVLQVEASLSVSKIDSSRNSLRCTIECKNLSVVAPKESPIAPMLEMVDLTKPGRLLEWLPELPVMITEIMDEHVTIDILKLGVVTKRPWLNAIIQSLLSVVSLSEVRVGNQAVLIQWKVDQKRISKLLSELGKKLRVKHTSSKESV